MKANELRIGIRVIDPGIQREDQTATVVGFLGNDVWVEYPYVNNFGNDCTNIVPIKLTKIKPIPLTPEWLEKFGFEKYDDFEGGTMTTYRQGDFFIHTSAYNNVDPWMNITIYESKVQVEIKYVHQLLNLYFSLTGSELTIKEKV